MCSPAFRGTQGQLGEADLWAPGVLRRRSHGSHSSWHLGGACHSSRSSSCYPGCSAPPPVFASHLSRSAYPSLSFFWTEPHRRLEKAMLESFGFLLSCSFPLLRRPALPAPSPPSLWTSLAHLAPQCWALGLGGSPHPVPGPVAFLLASQVASGRHLPLVCALS